MAFAPCDPAAPIWVFVALDIRTIAPLEDAAAQAPHPNSCLAQGAPCE